MTKVTRTKLLRCSVADCPRPDSEAFHRNACGHWDQPPTHEHHPKKQMGGKRKASRIRLCICATCHDLADNFGGSAIVQTKDGKRYIGWQGHDSDPIKRKVLWDVPLDAHELVEETDDGQADEIQASIDIPIAGTGSADQGGGEQRPSLGVRRSESNARTDRLRDKRSETDADRNRATNRGDAYSLTEQGIDFDECTFDDWKSAWSQVAGLTRNRQWWVGDAWSYAEERWPSQHGQIANELVELAGLRIETISNYANVAKAFPKARRRALSFDHHATVYKLPPKEAEDWLDRAEAEGLSSTELRALVRPPKAQPKRWSVEELREALGEALHLRNNVYKFLDWLQEQQE